MQQHKMTSSCAHSQWHLWAKRFSDGALELIFKVENTIRMVLESREAHLYADRRVHVCHNISKLKATLVLHSKDHSAAAV